MIKIKKISSLEILDSRGIPTVKTKIEAGGGIISEASIPSGSSCGKAEAKELRDKDRRFLGKGTQKAVSNVNIFIASKLKGKNIVSQKELDDILIELDGTSNKSRLGANAILSVSLAFLRLSANLKKITLYKYINQTFFKDTKLSLPTPFSVVIEAGKHSSGNLDVQEFMIVPEGIPYFKEKVRAISEIYQVLGDVLIKKKQSANVGLEGAYGPNLNTNTEAMDIIQEAIKEAGYQNKVKLALDVAASELFLDDEDSYRLRSEGVTLKKQQLLGLYNDWISNYPIISLEDGLNEEDWSGWAEMTEKFSKKNVLSIGDDLFVTNPARIEKGIKIKAATGIIIKPNQIGTVSETLEAIKKAKEAGLECIVSHRSGETNDTFIADLAVASGAKYIKTGAPCRGERVEKYNRLIEISQEI